MTCIQQLRATEQHDRKFLIIFSVSAAKVYWAEGQETTPCTHRHLYVHKDAVEFCTADSVDRLLPIFHDNNGVPKLVHELLDQHLVHLVVC